MHPNPALGSPGPNQALYAAQTALIRNFPGSFFAWEREIRAAVRAAGLECPNDMPQLCRWCEAGLTGEQVVDAIRKSRMQFTVRFLSVVDYAQGWTGWVYKSPNQTVAEILSPGFFSNAVDMMAHGDLLTISGTDGVAQRAVMIRDKAVVLEVLK